MGIPFDFNPIGLTKTQRKMPTSGMTYYMPFNESYKTPVKGNSRLLLVGTEPTLETLNGIQCMTSNGIFTGYLYEQNTATYWTPVANGLPNVSFSMWLRPTTSNGDIVFSAGENYRNSTGASFILINTSGRYRMLLHNNSELISKYFNNYTANKWEHYAMVFDSANKTLTAYQNGVLVGSSSTSSTANMIYHTTLSFFVEFGSQRAGSAAVGGLAGFRIYDRVLSAEEIALLAHEFTPILEPVFNNQNVSFNNDTGATTKQLVAETYGRQHRFRITAGTLPTGVTFDGTTGTFTFDGTEIQEDQDYFLTVELTGDHLTTTTATVTVKMRVAGIYGPTENLQFYHALNESTTTPNIGTSMTLSGTVPTPTTEEGIDCLLFNNGCYWQRDGEYWTGTGDLTLSIWCKCLNTANAGVLATGIWNNFNAFEIMKNTGIYSLKLVSSGNSEIDVGYTRKNNELWHHLLGTLNRTTNKFTFYVDGENMGEQSIRTSTNIPQMLTIAGNANTSYQVPRDKWFYGYLAGARVYDRVLTAEEIATLANEFDIIYPITANDLSFSLYQKSESYNITYSAQFTPTFEIVEGTLPSTISFNTSTGQFTGKGLTDADHVYNLKVRITAAKSTPKEVNVTIHTYMTARISLSNQTFNFISNKAENFAMSYTSDETVTFMVESGTMPAGMTLSGNKFYSNGQNTSAENKQVVIRATSEHNQTGVTATMTLNMQMNAIICNAQAHTFYALIGTTTFQVAYSGSLNTVSDAVFSMTGTLPTGVTFNSSTGTFTSDGTQTAAETATVSVTVSSSSGTSTAATATITLDISMADVVDPIIESGMTLFIPCRDGIQAQAGLDLDKLLTDDATTATVDGVPCIYLDGSCAYGKDDSSYFTKYSDGGPHLTLCFWFKADSPQDRASSNGGIIQAGDCKNYTYSGGDIQLLFDSSMLPYRIDEHMEGHWGQEITNTPTQWHFFAMKLWRQNNNQYLNTYVDGVNKGGQSRGFQFPKSNLIALGTLVEVPMTIRANTTVKGWISRIRLYDRVLTDAEITQLYGEFTPTT